LVAATNPAGFDAAGMNIFSSMDRDFRTKV
jgi:hypothetical protein